MDDEPGSSHPVNRAPTHRSENAEAESRSARERLPSVFKRVDDAFVALDKDWCLTLVIAEAGELRVSRLKGFITILGELHVPVPP